MPQQFTTFAMIALLIVAFYFLILRPQKKRQQAQAKTMNELVPGTRVLLGSGLFGTLTWVGTKQARMEVGHGQEVTVLKQAIARVVTPGDEYSEPLDGEHEAIDADDTDAVSDDLDRAQEPTDLGPYATERPVQSTDAPGGTVDPSEPRPTKE